MWMDGVVYQASEWQSKAMLNSMLLNKNFLTQDLIGWRLSLNYLFSVIVTVSQNHGNVGYLLNVMLIFDRRHRSLAVVAFVKYKLCDSKDLRDNPATSKLYLNKWGFSALTSGLLAAGLSVWYETRHVIGWCWWLWLDGVNISRDTYRWRAPRVSCNVGPRDMREKDEPRIFFLSGHYSKSATTTYVFTYFR